MAGVITANSAPGGGDQEIGDAVAINIAYADCIEAKGLSGNATGNRFENMTVLTGLTFRLSG